MKLCCGDHAFPLLQVQLAEMEGLSLNSDKSSILLGDDGDNHSMDQLSHKETQVEACWDLGAYILQCLTFATFNWKNHWLSWE